MKKMKKIRVIQIIDEFTVLINIGRASGEVSQDDYVIIYEEGPEIKVIDGTSLGKYEFKKATLMVTDVQQQFSVAKHVKKTSALSVSNILGGNHYTSKGLLPIQDKIEKIKLSPENKNILVGDLVRIIKS